MTEDPGTVLANSSLVTAENFGYLSDIIAKNNGPESDNRSSLLKTDLSHYGQDECMDLFDQNLISEYRFVLLELDHWSSNITNLNFSRHVGVSWAIHRHNTDAYAWICGIDSNKSWTELSSYQRWPPCNVPETQNGTDWKPFGYNVSGCYTHTYPENYRLEIASQLAIMTIGVSFVKALVLLFVAIRPTSAPLLTIGDAISSFLTDPDPHTSQMPFCRLGKKLHQSWAWTFSPMLIFGWPRWRKRKIHAAGESRTALYLLL